MSDLRSSFPTLEDIDNSNEGAALSQAVEGDTITGRNFHGALVAKDASDQLQFMKVNSSNELIVDIDSSEIAELTGTGSGTDVTTEEKIASITLQASTSYEDLEATLSCFRDCVARIVAVDDVGVTDVETELVSGIRVGPGNTTWSDAFEAIGKFTSGSTGVQELQILATVLNPAAGSDVDATLGIKELQ